ncbi:MAG: SdrD B-like domain-containing protein [Oscillochloridaceae bacterium]|nr:hypothetical protein [Chloroflexaceae bacterium]MDW8389142.1 SdrD B-like domain-containing protein [Oscillochloridaceae bacterium]
MPLLPCILALHRRRRNAFQVLAAVLAALAFLPLLMVLLPPRQVAAQGVLPSGSAVSTGAVPCLAAPTYAVARGDDTIFEPRANVNAILEVSPSGTRALAPLGQRPPGSPASARVQNGLGAVYGLAYDDGALSGAPRLFAAAHLRRFTAFGPGGPGAIYAINPVTGAWSLFASVPGNHWERSGNDRDDSATTARTGTSGLGGIAMHPEGRHLFIVNISERRIERLDVTTGAFLPPLSLAGAYAAIGQDTTVTYPFAIAFTPQPVNDAPAMLVGFTNRDTATVFVATFYRTPGGAWTWGASLTQNLRSGAMLDRLDGTSLSEIIITSPANGIGGSGAAWNPWVDSEGAMARVNDTVAHPQPVLTDLTFAPDGQTLFLGIRDRAGDQLFFRSPPPGGYQVSSQGDTLAYRWTGSGWSLVSVSRTDPLNRASGDGRTWPAHRYDAFTDNLHQFAVGATPPHTENHMGGLATLPTGADPARAQVVVTQLFGVNQAAVSFYAGSGGQESAFQTIVGHATPTKAAALGDIEPLCTYAYVQGVIWEDDNRDGVRQDSEPRRANIPVELTDAAGTVLATVATDGQGRYRFAAPPNRDLRVRIAPAAFAAGGALPGATYTTPNASSDLSRDSDAGPQGVILAGVGSNLLNGSPHDREAARLARQEDRRTLDMGVRAGLDLAISLTAPAQARSGDPFAYDVTIRNLTTTSSADNVQIILSLPPGLERLDGGMPVIWNVGALGPGDARAYRVRVRAPRPVSPPSVTAMARVTTTTPETDYSNNEAVAATTIQAPDVAVGFFTPERVLVGAPFWALLQAGNWSSDALARSDDAVVTVSLSSGLVFDDDGQSIRTFNLGALAPGEWRNLWLPLRPTLPVSDPAAPPLVTISARITTTTPEWTLLNNQAMAAVAIVAPDLVLTKAAPPEALVGAELTYTLTVRNRGSTVAWQPRLSDPLPRGVSFVSVDHPACTYDAPTHAVRCAWNEHRPDEVIAFRITVRPTVEAEEILQNTATVTTSTAGDPPGNNSATATTRVLFPDVAISLAFNPSPLPVGEWGDLVVAAVNRGTGTAYDPTIEVTIDDGATPGTLPSQCRATGPVSVRCTASDLRPNGSQVWTLRIPIRLPATPADANNFPADAIGARGSISTSTPERPADRANNTAATTADVIRPNVYVTARGPAAIIGWGSIFAYEVDYGNLYRRRPDLTRAAIGVTLRITLPPDVQFLRATITPGRKNGRVLEWDLGDLAPRFRSSQPLTLVVQTSVPAGRHLRMEAVIATVTPGDDPADNRAVEETPVDPPPTIEQGQARLRLAINSEFDPLTGGANPTDAIYLTEGTRFAWPAGETLRFTPRLTELVFPNEWDPLLLFPHYEYRARVTGWRVTGYQDDRGIWHDPRAGAGTMGCAQSPTGLPGCMHAYLGGATLDEIRANRSVREDEIARQAHVYWSHAPLPLFSERRGHAYGLERLAPVGIRVAVDAEVWIVNTAPDPGDLWDGEAPEIPVAPLPPPQQQVYEETFTVHLVAPRSVVGPGSVPR